jgi:hypothetical protein
MHKWLILLLLMILTVGAWASYDMLTARVMAGNANITSGEAQIAEGEKALADGKAKLARGQQKLSQAKHAYHDVRSLPFLNIVDKVPLVNMPFQVVHESISAGDAKVRSGSEKIAAGEKQLAAGKLEIQNGKTRLVFVNEMRFVCAACAIIFAALFVGLGLYWRKALMK